MSTEPTAQELRAAALLMLRFVASKLAEPLFHLITKGLTLYEVHLSTL